MDALHKILEREELTSTQKVILIVLKVIPEDEAISFNDLAFYTSLTRQTVITNLNKLESAGLLQINRDSTNTNSYKVLI